ncbi:hypothetical protein [Salininema proteolyticum]|uniref:ABC transporter permease n=1 Tax=Salininema proteolyticum TaxID=1607685 RepID=A0ABV8U5E7_9ACTN
MHEPTTARKDTGPAPETDGWKRPPMGAVRRSDRPNPNSLGPSQGLAISLLLVLFALLASGLLDGILPWAD